MLFVLTFFVILGSTAMALDGTINVFSFPPAMYVNVSGPALSGVTLVQTTPAVFKVPYGQYDIVVYNGPLTEQTYMPQKFVVNAKYGKSVTVRARPEPVTGDIRIRALAFTNISIERIGGPLLDVSGSPYDGSYISKGITNTDWMLYFSRFYEGTYNIKASKAGYNPQEKTVKIGAGRANPVIFNMMKER